MATAGQEASDDLLIDGIVLREQHLQQAGGWLLGDGGRGRRQTLARCDENRVQQVRLGDWSRKQLANAQLVQLLLIVSSAGRGN